MNVGELIVSALTGPVKSLAKEKLVELLESLRAKDIAAYKTVLVSLYPPIDVQLQGLAIKTKTKLDDAIVEAFKEAIEESATRYGVTLPNLDAD